MSSLKKMMYENIQILMHQIDQDRINLRASSPCFIKALY